MIEEVKKIEIPTRFIPKGAELIEAYKTDKEIVILGEPEWVREHNCDAMGCATLTHVIYRFPICQIFPKSPDNPDGYEPKPQNVITNSGKKLIERVAREEGMEISIEPKPEYNQEVCQHSGLDPTSNYAEPICRMGHGWSSDCDRGMEKACPDFTPARVPTLDELKEQFGKPKPDRLLTEDEIVAYSTKDGEYCQLAVDVGIWARDKTAPIIRAECQERVIEMLDGIENPYPYDEHWTIAGYKKRAFDEAIQTIKQALKEGVK